MKINMLRKRKIVNNLHYKIYKRWNIHIYFRKYRHIHTNICYQEQKIWWCIICVIFIHLFFFFFFFCFCNIIYNTWNIICIQLKIPYNIFLIIWYSWLKNSVRYIFLLLFKTWSFRRRNKRNIQYYWNSKAIKILSEAFQASIFLQHWTMKQYLT